MRPYGDLPNMTNEARAIRLTMRMAAGASGGGKTPSIAAEALIAKTFTVTKLLVGISDVTRILAMSDRQRMLKLTPEETMQAIATMASGVGVSLKDAASEVDMPMLREFVMYALPGSAPPRTGLAVAQLGLDLLRTEFVKETGHRGIVGLILWIRLHEWYLSVINTPANANIGTAIGLAVEDGHKQRIAETAQLGAKHAAFGHSAWFTASEHAERWLSHPWVMNATHALNAELVASAIMEYRDRGMAFLAFGPWPELVSGPFDVDIIGIELPTVKAPMTKEPPDAGDNHQPLADDLSVITLVSHDAVSKWLDRFRAYVTGAEQTFQAAKASLGDLQPSYTIVPPGAGEPITPSELGVVGISKAAGYPLYSALDPTRIWSAAPRAERALGMHQWNMQTAAGVFEAMSEASPYVPVVVIGGAAPLASNDPVIIPIVRNLTEHGLFGEPALDVLCRLWDVTPQQLRYRISTMLASAESYGVRALAHALRFVGMTYLVQAKDVVPSNAVTNGDQQDLVSWINVKKGAPVQVPPFERHYYHSTSDEGSALSDTAFILGSAQGEGAAKGTWHLVLRPFTHIPTTALLSDMPIKLGVIPYGKEQSKCSAVRWISQDMLRSADKMGIIGWAAADAHVWDIILLPVGESGNRITTVLGLSDAQPTWVRPFNAIVSLAPRGLPDYNGTVSRIPAPAVIG
jgi:hypothetical protein